MLSFIDSEFGFKTILIFYVQLNGESYYSKLWRVDKKFLWIIEKILIRVTHMYVWYNFFIIISYLQVSWFRKQNTSLNLLTIGKDSFSADPRYSVAFRKPENWRLKIRPVMAKDNGTYLCQVSTHPPIIFLQHLKVIGKIDILQWIKFMGKLDIFVQVMRHIILSLSFQCSSPSIFGGWR